MSAWSLLFPDQCALCGQPGTPVICEDCRVEIGPPQVGERTLGDDDVRVQVRWLWPYEGRIAQAVRRLKYDRITALAAPLAQLIADHSDDWCGSDPIIAVPIHWRRRFDRGFNQSELLAAHLPATRNGRALRRKRFTRPQVGLAAARRRIQLAGAFKAGQVPIRCVLLDDVVTTGGTVLACAEALYQAGVHEVRALCLTGSVNESNSTLGA
ncbi:MAG: ComF family protein [Fimbriimonadaceae bacterium]|nr:ComF family protein [Fimbriimonadaceae bacterium]